MKYLTEKEFEKEMTQIKQQKRQYEMRKELREAKRRFPKFKKPRTSKMVLWTVIAICIRFYGLQNIWQLLQVTQVLCMHLSLFLPH